MMAIVFRFERYFRRRSIRGYVRVTVARRIVEECCSSNRAREVAPLEIAWVLIIFANDS